MTIYATLWFVWICYKYLRGRLCALSVDNIALDINNRCFRVAWTSMFVANALMLPWRIYNKVIVGTFAWVTTMNVVTRELTYL